jgi:hypothetical protein
MSSAAYKYIKYAMFAGVRFTELEEIPLHSLYPPTPSSPISVHRMVGFLVLDRVTKTLRREEKERERDPARGLHIAHKKRAADRGSLISLSLLWAYFKLRTKWPATTPY